MMDQRRMFDDGKAQSGAAHFLGTAFIHPVEALENALLILRGDTNAGVADSEHGFPALIPDREGDAAVFLVVFYGIVAEIIANAVEQLGHAGKADALPAEVYGYMGLLRCQGKTVHRILRNIIKIAFLPLHFRRAIIQTAEGDHVLYQAAHALAFAVNLAGKILHILGLNHSVGQQLRIAGDGVQGGF